MTPDLQSGSRLKGVPVVDRCAFGLQYNFVDGKLLSTLADWSEPPLIEDSLDHKCYNTHGIAPFLNSCLKSGFELHYMV